MPLPSIEHGLPLAVAVLGVSHLGCDRIHPLERAYIFVSHHRQAGAIIGPVGVNENKTGQIIIITIKTYSDAPHQV